MDKIRIYAVAQELGIPAQELLAYFEEDGLSFSSHLALVDAVAADRARAHFAVQEGARAETVLSPSPTQADKVMLDFAPFQVEGPAQPVAEEHWHDDESFAASKDAVQKVEQKVAAAAQAPLRQSLLASVMATASVAVVPTFVAFSIFVFGQPNPRPFMAILLSVLLTAGSVVVGSAVWATQPESAGFSFGDLMLWSWVRREAAERTLIQNSAILGFDRFGRFLGHSTASKEEQMRAVREIGAALDAKSSYTLGHSRRVEKHARKVAQVMGLSEAETASLATAASLHDIGNIQIPDGLLRKTGELTIEERSAIEAHVLLGARMVLKAGGDVVVDGIRHHHERWDGAGYPGGLAGEEIPLFARIIGIAEAYDAMTSTRPYRQGFTRDHAIEVLRSEGGLQFDGDLVEMFVSTLPESMAIFRKVPLLGRAQGQLHELQLVFKRMGAVAISATASTIAIALLLGGTVLAPGTTDVPDVADKGGRVTPIDRVLASRMNGEQGAYDEDAPLSDALAPIGTSAARPTSKYNDNFVDGSLDGDELALEGGTGGETEGPGEEPGEGPGENPGPGPGENPGLGATPPGGGTTNPGPYVGGSTGTKPDMTAPTPGTTNPPPTAAPTPTDPPGPGNGNGKGEDKNPDAPGNGHAYGRDKDNGNGNGNTDPGPPEDKGNSGNGNGNSANAPGHNKDDDAPAAPTTPAPDPSPANDGNGNGNGNGNSGDSGLGAGAGTSAPGNSGNAPGQNKDDDPAPAPSATEPDSSPGNSGNSNGQGNGK